MGDDNDWKHGMFGCFDHCGLCIWTFFCPCLAFGKGHVNCRLDTGSIVFGKNAAALGDSRCLYTCFYFIPIFNIYLKIRMRGRIREAQNIGGTCCGDVLWSLLCGFCTFMQERQECIEGLGGEEMARQ